jgi:type VI secretion system secreted protein Hcp
MIINRRRLLQEGVRRRIKMRVKKLGIIGLVWVMMLVAAGTAFGQVEAYMRIDGISGKFRIDTGLTDWTQISGMPDPYSVSFSPAKTGSYEEGKAAYQDFSIVKDLDKSSPALDMACTQGKNFPRITIEFYKAKERNKPFYKIEMTTVFVAGITQEKDDDARMERVTFRCQRIVWKYGFPQK